MLRSRRDDELAAEALREPRVLRCVVGRLWEPDPALRQGAARTLASVAARDPERGREWMRRFVWALNDESGTNGGPVLEAVRELARRAPAALASHVGCLVSLLGDPGLRPGLLAVFAQLVESAPDLLAGHAEELERALAGTGVEERDTVDSIRRSLRRGR